MMRTFDLAAFAASTRSGYRPSAKESSQNTNRVDCRVRMSQASLTKEQQITSRGHGSRTLQNLCHSPAFSETTITRRSLTMRRPPSPARLLLPRTPAKFADGVDKGKPETVTRHA